MLKRLRFIAAALIACVSSAYAMEAPPLSLDDPGVEHVARLATPRNTDYAAKLTLYWENDGGWAKSISDTDKHYTAGVGAALSFQAPWIDSLLGASPPSATNSIRKPATTPWASSAR